MKILVIALSLILSNSAFASSAAKSIYHVLKIDEENTCQSRICPNSIETFVKKLKGLSCYKTTRLSEGMPTSYKCSITSVAARTLYMAMSVEAVNACQTNTCPNSKTTMVKSVEGLTCSETTSQSLNNPTNYSCKFDF
jgi:hypothetical protein